MSRNQNGFTLFEVLISLMIITIAILSTLMILPVGLRAEHHARSELVAASTAVSLFENFHNPLITFRGHGQLAPELSHNLNQANPSQPPVPGWGNRLRDLNLTTSTYSEDFEHMLAGWVQGVAPVPLVIARRLDSDGDEIQNILDQGGYLFYMDPSYVRGLTVTADRDQAPVLNPPVEAQRLIFAVSGYAQQNTLPSHPLESLPWYELYPFPPEWVAMRAHGMEFRRGPMDLVAVPPSATNPSWSWDNNQAGNAQWFNPTIEGRSINYTHSYSIDDQGMGKARGGLEWGDKGLHSTMAGVQNPDLTSSGWNPVWFDPAPSNYMMMLQSQPSNNLVAMSGTPIDPDDPVDTNMPAGQPAACPGWYQGRNWRYFAQNYPGTPWDAGWVPFEKLAGYNADVGGTMSQMNYASQDVGNQGLTHYERAGWLPCMACLMNTDEPGFDRPYWTNAISLPQNGVTWNNPIASDPGQIGASPVAGGPPNVPGASPNWPGLTSNPEDLDNQDYSSVIGAPNSVVPLPTYEMRADYRDKAIDLWNAVTTSIPNVYHPVRSSIGGHAPQVDNTEIDCDMYEYGPQELDNFLMVDPSQLPATPHPAQILALSYLAHAAMLITGWNAPFASYPSAGRLDWDILTWKYFEPPANAWPITANASVGLQWQIPQGPLPNTQVNPFVSKDAKLVATGTTAPIGSSTVQIQNDTPTDMCLYAGDEIVFESDYREWFRRSMPAPSWQTETSGYTQDHSGFFGTPGNRMMADCRRYRVRSDIYVVSGQIGTMTVDPPLVTEIDATTKSWPDSWASVYYNPPIAIATPHPQQFIRVCNEHDKAFARKVHEMCMEWTSRYCADNPYDTGAPRMMNHQVMMDKPLAIMDMFMDASVGSSTEGHAVRIPNFLPNGVRISPLESFYRWMIPPNVQPNSWFQTLHVQNGNVHEPSHFGPGRNSFTAFKSLVYNPQLAPASTSAPGPTNPWNWSTDDTHYWVNRHFNAFHRGRELVFWSADWLSYADAETAPSAPLDWAKHGRSIQLANDGQTPVNVLQMYYNQGDGSQWAGNPENGVVWGDATHNFRWYDSASNTIWYAFYWAHALDGPDINLGHWGADRNGNRKLDIGPVPITSRMHADTIARFTFYDPILRLNVNN